MPQLIRPTSTLFPVAILLLAIICVQVGAAVAKSMFPVAGALGMVAVRIALGTIILGAVLRPWRVRIVPGSRTALAIYGASLGVMNALYYSALSRVPLGITVALEFTGPLTVAVLASRRPTDFCWAVLAAAGLLLLLPLGPVSTLAQAGAIDPLGALLALGAGACWALYIVFGQKAGSFYGAQTVALGSIISAILIIPVGLLVAPPAVYTSAVLVPGLLVAILSTALPYTLEMMALTRLPTRTFGILMSLEPAFAALFGYVHLHEHLTSIQWTAIALIIIASIGTTASVQQKVAVPVPD
ncbi:MAG TPA: EamA family transporter [Steroidobacteraceae bacterium]|nr:EamA family transporter [Steroidobacteraceae bacterium]